MNNPEEGEESEHQGIKEGFFSLSRGEVSKGSSPEKSSEYKSIAKDDDCLIG